MKNQPMTDWQSEFGIDEVHTSHFYANKSDLDAEIPMAPYTHIVRRAFDLLELDGVWCDQNTPLVYFKVVKQINLAEIAKLHQLFWNHGGAAILVIIAPSEVQIYSALTLPSDNDSTQVSAFVKSIQRATQALQEFLPSVESGKFFHEHSYSFDKDQRVDQTLLRNLQAAREELGNIENNAGGTNPDLDAFLCRLVFTSYLFDREIIGTRYLDKLGIPSLSHLRDILNVTPYTLAKDYLYRLFHKLAEDFNGDLFSDDLIAESENLTEDHIAIVRDFFDGKDIITGQKSIWPYDFGVIPIETISAIYEHFLKPSKKSQGSFYTPRFLAELVLDISLKEYVSLLGLRFLDPSCGSGIFLVGVFNRIAEEWHRNNPNARNSRRARELMQLLQKSIFGIDINPTACRITAFSLYLAYLDQLTPRDIQDLQVKRNALPRLVITENDVHDQPTKGGIWIGDFFDQDIDYPKEIDVIIGNPPWGSLVQKNTLADAWCRKFGVQVPNKQIAAAFMWKLTHHIHDKGRICLLLPHGILFNREDKALNFQRDFITENSLDLVLNLTDYQSFLFSNARHPALVLSYRRTAPATHDVLVDYWIAKADWKVIQAGIITIPQQDRHRLSIRDIVKDLNSDDAPKIWKRAAWTSSRDHRLLKRLEDDNRLGDIVRQSRDDAPDKPWIIAEGYQPIGENDDPNKAKILDLPSSLFIQTSSAYLDLFLLREDCIEIDESIYVRYKSNKITEIFEAPHVLVNKGFSNIAFADFPVSFRHSLRGISGPRKDRDLLIFLTAYLRSSLAQYFLFHTSSNWGVSRSEVHVWELLRLPFPLPRETIQPERAEQIVEEVAHLVTTAMDKAMNDWTNRQAIVSNTQNEIEPLVFEYFDILPAEHVLIEDTINILIPSFRPGSRRNSIPTIEPSSANVMELYTSRLCKTLNSWIKHSNTNIVGVNKMSSSMGVGLVVIEKIDNETTLSLNNDKDILEVMKQLSKVSATKFNTIELLRGVKVFEGNRLYIVKPLSRRYWTETAALNDADEIAGSILMQSSREPV